MSQVVAIDATDKAIIRALQEDGRMSYADLAELVGLSAPAARQRMQRLIESKVLQIVAVTDPLKLGLPVMAMVGIAVDGDIRAVVERLSAIPQVIYVVSTAGSFDLFVEVVCPDMSELFTVVNQELKTLPGVQSTESFVYFDIHTHRFDWDVPR